MAGDSNIVLKASVEVFGLDADVDIQMAGGPVSIRLAPSTPVDFKTLWQDISNALEEIAGFGLPDLGAWKDLIDFPGEIMPALFVSPSGSDTGGLAAYLSLEFLEPMSIGGKIDLGHGVTVEITPHFTIEALYIGYEAGTGKGLDLRAKVTTDTTSTQGSPGAKKTQIVSYPFPVPAQDSAGTFQLNYIGLGQHVGPTVQVTATDPMAAIFDQLEADLSGDDPETILTSLAKNFYQPDRDWFVAADVELKGFRIRALLNDPTLYGLEITVADTPPTFFSGLLFEILYQKLGPNLGMYYGALTLPTLMRRIPLEGFILILPGFKIWVYTNGDFRVNVGWPMGSDSIGISMDLLVGQAGFYFAKLRSGDNPGANAGVDYNPILAFGIGVSLSADLAYNAGIFSARLDVSVGATFQGLLAWQAGNSMSHPPDHYWFAGTASLSVLIEGIVDFAIIKASVLISFTANASVGFETGYAAQMMIHAEVRVEVSLKVIFFTIHLSFHASIGTQFTIGSGEPASINGPLAKGLVIPGGYGSAELSEIELRQRMAADLLDMQRPVRMATLRRADPLTLLDAHARAAAAAPVPVALQFVLQPTATYGATSSFALIASLVADCPPPPGESPPPPPDSTSFGRLLMALVEWLLASVSGAKLSDQLAALQQALGQGAQPPLGDWATFDASIRNYLSLAVSLSIEGVALSGQDAPEKTVAMMPMLDCLQMQYTGPDGQLQSVDFGTVNPAPSCYAEAVALYFEDVGFDGSAPPEAAARQLSLTASPGPDPSVAAFVQTDYFLMLARNAVNQLLPAAIAYENAQQQLLAEGAGAPDAAEHRFGRVMAHAQALTPASELDTLFDSFDFASAAGVGSRFLIGGLQLPDPAQVPAKPTAQNMKAVPTEPFFVLTGQQFAASAGEVATATLSLSPLAVNPPGIQFEPGSPASDTRASFDLPATVPPIPDPSWIGVVSPTTGTAGSLSIGPLPPVASQPLFAAMKSKTVWQGATGTQTILPLGPDLSARLAAAPFQLAIAPEPPPATNAGSGVGASPGGSPFTPIDATPALVIPIRISQMPVHRFTNASGGGSPTQCSPDPATPNQFLPHLYQITGTDEVTRDLIHLALSGDLAALGAEISLLYPQQVQQGDQTQTLLVSTDLSTDVCLVKTNLSTLNEIQQVGSQFALQAALTTTEQNRAAISDAVGFLRLVWEVSVVNAQGFFLYYADASGKDLPADLFASPGSAGGGAVEVTILVRYTAAAGSQPSYPQCASAGIVAIAEVKDTLFAQVLDSLGVPVPVYASTYPAGDVALSMVWDRPQTSPEPPVPVLSLYHMLQYQVVANGAYDSTVWSLPIGPSSDNLPVSLRPQLSENEWHYVETIPAHLFRIGASPGTSRFDVIDTEIDIDLRIIDVYGNALSGSHRIVHTELYHDPLVALAEWPGVSSHYRVAPGAGGSAILEITLAFDPAAIAGSGTGSPGAAANARTAWIAAGRRYALLCEQMTGPGASLALRTTLTGQDPLQGQPEPQFLAFAQEVRDAIATALGQTASPAVPDVSPIEQVVAATIPLSAIAALADDIVPLGVALTIARDITLVAPEALNNLPAAQSVTSQIMPGLGNDSSPAGSGSLAQFAAPFEAAFDNFDGAGGCLKIAERAGVQTPNGKSDVPTVWVTRWSATSGISVTLDNELVHFALAPLSTTLISQIDTATGTQTSIDLDAWAYDFLKAFDAFLAPQLAAAIGILDIRNNTNLYNEILQVKSDLAGTVPKGVEWLFKEQVNQGDQPAAIERLTQAMLAQLSSAFEVTTVSQIRATVGRKAGGSPASPAYAPQLYGRVAPPDAQKTPTQPASGNQPAYTISNGALPLNPGTGWMSLLVTATNPGGQAQFDLPLEYQVSYLQHDFEPTEEYLGYVPSSWLKFAIPAAEPLTMPVTPFDETVAFPVPLIFNPPTPVLANQSAEGATIVSPTGGSASTIIEEALNWLYSVDLSLALSAQDQLFCDITYNRTDDLNSGLELMSRTQALQGLLEKLAAFRSWYATASAEFPTIAAAAAPNEGSGALEGSPGKPEALIADFLANASAVSNAWAALFDPNLTSTESGEGIITDQYWLQVTPASGEMTLARGLMGSAPPVWPEVTVRSGQSWAPSGSPSLSDSSPAPSPVSPSPGSPSAWQTISHDFGASPLPDFTAMTLCFGPHSILERQTATAAVHVRRNASILPNLTTQSDFVYVSQTAAFKNAIVPLIERGAAIAVPPGASLAQTMTEILLPLAAPSAALKPVLRIAAEYALTVASAPGSGPALQSRNAMRFFQSEAFRASPQTAGNDIAASLSDWIDEIAPSSAGGTLMLAFTVFGSIEGQQLPLIQLDTVTIDVSGVTPGWWTARV
jgi:hypothetical protein